MKLSIEAAAEAEPGPRWQRFFEALWPSYRAWFLAEGDAARPTFLECERALREHLPEMMPLWERLSELAGGGDLEARFLSLYCPPPYLQACSQAVWLESEPFMVRNYDYSPRLFEGIVLRSAWSGRAAIASTDCLIGALDGINEDGLAASLSFGGRREVGRGFGAPLLLRAILEFCSTARQAAELMRRVPTHMAYNILVLDAAGDFATAFTRPGGGAEVRRVAVSTNHQEEVHWPRHAEATGSVEREDRLRDLLAAPGATAAGFVEEFLRPPLRSRSYDRGSGTLYTAVYRPARRDAEFLWPGASWRQSLSAFEEGRRDLEL